MKFDIPKDKVDEVLNNRIKELTKENKALEKKLQAAEAKIQEHCQCIKTLEDLKSRFHALIDEYSSHESCGGL